MIELSSHLKAVIRFAIFFLSACFIVWALFPPYRVYAAGLILGTLSGMYNALHLARRVRRIIGKAAEQKIRNANTGFISRAAIVFIAAVIAIKFPRQFNLISMLIGLFLIQAAILAIAISKRNSNGES